MKIQNRGIKICLSPEDEFLSFVESVLCQKITRVIFCRHLGASRLKIISFRLLWQKHAMFCVWAIFSKLSRGIFLVLMKTNNTSK